MKLLLDTHVLLWWLGDYPKLKRGARDLMTSGKHDVYYSIASPWEMAIKIGLGKLDLNLVEAVTAFETAGFRALEIATSHLALLTNLQRLHGDPFDRLIVAQAIVEGATVMTDDAAILRYPVNTVGCG